MKFGNLEEVALEMIEDEKAEIAIGVVRERLIELEAAKEIVVKLEKQYKKLLKTEVPASALICCDCCDC